MSVIAVKIDKKKITLGADSILVNGKTQWKDRDAKIFSLHKGDLVVASTGTAAECSIFKYFCKKNKPTDTTPDAILEFMSKFLNYLKTKFDSDYTIDNVYFIVYKKKVFLVDDFFIKEITEYDASGVGRDFALASLYLGHSVEEAIKVACHLSTHCEEPINIIEIKK